jgi:hypothetical protein
MGRLVVREGSGEMWGPIVDVFAVPVLDTFSYFLSEVILDEIAPLRLLRQRRLGVT